MSKRAKHGRAGTQAVQRFAKEYEKLRRDYRQLAKRDAMLVDRFLRAASQGRNPALLRREHPLEADGPWKERREPAGDPPEFFAARAASRPGAGRLGCGCDLILTAPQPNGEVDVCFLVGCEDAGEGRRPTCEYYCITLREPELVAIAARS